jgi:hypothetical protein
MISLPFISKMESETQAPDGTFLFDEENHHP